MVASRYGIAALLVPLLSAGCVSIKANIDADVSGSSGRVLRHVVLFKYKDGTTDEQADDIKRRFLELKDKIDGIVRIEGNNNISPENLSQGFTHCFMVTFVSEAARDAYIPHAAHQEFAASLKPYVDKVLVVDFWAEH